MDSYPLCPSEQVLFALADEMLSCPGNVEQAKPLFTLLTPAWFCVSLDLRNQYGHRNPRVFVRHYEVLLKKRVQEAAVKCRFQTLVPEITALQFPVASWAGR